MVLTRPEGNFRIILIVFLTSFFTLKGAVSRRYVTNHSKKDIYDEFHAKYRSSEIIITSILCYFTLKNKIYIHHSFSLLRTEKNINMFNNSFFSRNYFS